MTGIENVRRNLFEERRDRLVAKINKSDTFVFRESIGKFIGHVYVRNPLAGHPTTNKGFKKLPVGYIGGIGEGEGLYSVHLVNTDKRFPLDYHDMLLKII